MRFFFAPRFNRAELYGFIAFIVAMGNGVSPLVALPVMLVWIMFSVAMEDRLEARK